MRPFAASTAATCSLVIRLCAVQLQGGRRPLELAADGGVYENEPEVRTDVVRSDEFEPDVIPVAQMRSTRTMWARKELQHDQPAARQVLHYYCYYFDPGIQFPGN